MEKQIITFSANEQTLTKTGGLGAYSSNKVSYIEAVFALGDNWSGYDSVRAVWSNDYKTISTVLDSNGHCLVPHEVLTARDKVRVNLVGSISVGNVLTDRITSYPVVAFVVDAVAKTDGSETAAVTPSQFEQFAEAVRDEADRAEAAMDAASGYADDAAESADRAEQAATSAGYMFFHIDDDPTSATFGHLIYERTNNTEVDFYLGSDGHLYVEAIA